MTFVYLQVEVESQTEGRDLELEESQIHEYNRLKEEAAKRSTALNTEIEKLQREQQNDQEKLVVFLLCTRLFGMTDRARDNSH